MADEEKVVPDEIRVLTVDLAEAEAAYLEHIAPGRTLQEIAEAIGCRVDTARRLLEWHGIAAGR